MVIEKKMKGIIGLEDFFFFSPSFCQNQKSEWEKFGKHLKIIGSI